MSFSCPELIRLSRSGQCPGQGGEIVSGDMYPAPVLTRPAPTHSPRHPGLMLLVYWHFPVLYPVPRPPDALSNLKTVHDMMWHTDCADNMRGAWRLLTERMCAMRGSGVTQRKGWDQWKWINSESGADMSSAPSPPPHRGMGLSADVMREHWRLGSWTLSGESCDKHVTNKWLARIREQIMLQLIFSELFIKDYSCLLRFCVYQGK